MKNNPDKIDDINNIIREKILNVNVDFGITEHSLETWIEKQIKTYREGTLSYICTTNPEFLMLAQHDEGFKNILNKSSLSLPDGFGVILAHEYIQSIQKATNSFFYPLILLYKGLILGFKSFAGNFSSEKYLLPGSDMIYTLCDCAERNNYSVFFLGGRPKDFFGNMKTVNYDLATITANEIKRLYPNINIIGASSAFSSKKEDDNTTVSYIKKCMQESNCSSIDILFVAYGAPSQEKWIVRNSSKVGAKISIGVGGSFNYISGDVKKPTHFIKKFHLEWFYRLLLHPWRIKRILIAFPIFPIKLYLYYIKKHKSY